MAETTNNFDSEKPKEDPKKREKTPAQKEAERKRLEKATSSVPSSGTSFTPEVQSLETMTASGDDFKPNSKQYDMSFAVEDNNLVYKVAAFPVVHLAKAGEYLSIIPPILVSLAMSYDEEQGYTMEGATKIVNMMFARRFENGEKAEVEVDNMTYSFAQISILITKEVIDSMVSYVLLNLKRRQKEITREDIESWLDINTFVDFLRASFRANPALRKRF